MYHPDAIRYDNGSRFTPEVIDLIAAHAYGGLLRRIASEAVRHSFAQTVEQTHELVRFDSPCDPVQSAVDAKLHGNLRSLANQIISEEGQDVSSTIFLFDTEVGTAEVTRETVGKPQPRIRYSAVYR